MEDLLIIPRRPHLTAWSKSASLKTIRGLFPPISSVLGKLETNAYQGYGQPYTFLTDVLEASITRAPVAVDPVNAILSMPGCRTIAAPALFP